MFFGRIFPGRLDSAKAASTRSATGSALDKELNTRSYAPERGNEAFPGHEAFNFEIGKLFPACSSRAPHQESSSKKG